MVNSAEKLGKNAGTISFAIQLFDEYMRNQTEINEEMNFQDF